MLSESRPLPHPPLPHAPGCDCDAHVAHRSRVPAWLGPVALGTVALGACVFTALNDPNEGRGLFPPCPFKSATGWDCPGCGMTRGVYALLHGDAVRMLDHNLLLLLLIPSAIWMFGRWTLSSFGVQRIPTIGIKTWQSTALLIFIVSFWIVRNLPGPLSVLDATAG